MKTLYEMKGHGLYQTRTLLTIGNGRLAQHLSYAHSLFQYPDNSLSSDSLSRTPNHLDSQGKMTFLHWHREQGESELRAFISQADVISLCLSDDQLESFYAKHIKPSQRKDQVVVHHSGVKNIPGVSCIHPLMTFTFPQKQPNSKPQFYTMDVYKKIHFVITPDENSETSLEIQAQELFQLCFPGWTNSVSYLPANKKIQYHMACVLAGNFSTLLWQQAAREFQNLKIDIQALAPYLEQTLKNFEADSFGSLTGPLARNDQKTIQAHLEVLKDHRFLEVYQSFVSAYQKQNPSSGGKQ